MLRMFPIELCQKGVQKCNEHVQTNENCFLLQPNSWQCVNNVMGLRDSVDWRAHLKHDNSQYK